MLKKKILVIDDEKDFTDMVKLNLEMAGDFIVKAENKGTNGYSTAKKFKPDLILLDIMMPDMDGGDVLFKINGDEELRKVPIVFLTALVKPGEDEGIDNRISDRPALAKPISAERLIAYVKDIIR